MKLYDFKNKPHAMMNYIIRMLNRTTQIFKYDGLPDTIPAYMLEGMLQRYGCVGFAEVEGNLYAFRGGLGGEPDVYYRPTIFTVSNPALNYSKNLVIDKECVIVKNDSNLMGLLDMFRKYATAMVENDISFDKASKNFRASFLISAQDDETRDSAQAFLENMESGESATVGETPFLEGLSVQPLMSASASRMMSELIEYHQYLKASWYNELGLNANYNMKRESLTTAESDMNFDALLPLIDDMLECRKIGIEKVNKMFGTNISVSLGSAWADIHETLVENPYEETNEEPQTADDGGDADGDDDKGQTEAE